jgi:hypothetical protein
VETVLAISSGAGNLEWISQTILRTLLILRLFNDALSNEEKIKLRHKCDYE